jgi:CO/xanthine dehydrogenase Mo-binding subunit
MVCAETPYFVSGQEISDADLAAETLDAAVDSSGWEGRYREQEPVSATIGPREVSSRYRTGIGIGAMVYGANLHHGGQRFDRGGAHVLVQPDGTINVSIGNTEMGQGALAAGRAIASEALGVEQSRIRISEVDTAVVPDSGPTVASRGTQVSGRAIIDACAVVRKRIKEVGASMLGSVPAVQVEIEGDLVRDPVSGREVDFEEVIAEYYERRINPLAVGWFRSEDRRYDPASGTGSPYAYYCFATHIARVRVDTWTGHVKVLEVTAAHDVGKAVHPPSLEGQIQGGVTQAVGWSTLEELVLHRGMLRNRGFTDYLIPTTTDAPKVVIRLIEKPEEHGPFGAKGIGEPSFIPCGAAVLNAVSNALGIELCEMPLTAERVRASIAGGGTGDGKPGQPYLSHLSPPDRDR